MALSALGRTFWALGAAVLLLVIGIAGLPYVASTQIVRERIAQELTEWSGYHVTLGAAPDIEVWPSFRAVLTDVSFAEWGVSDEPPVLAAERMEVGLSPLAAITGDVAITRVDMVRPILRLRQARTGLSPESPIGGRMIAAVQAARRAIADNSATPDLGTLPTDPFGTVSFNDGRILIMRGGQEREFVTGLAGSISWPALNRQAKVSASGIWRGENVAFDGAADQPLLLMAEGRSHVVLDVKSAPLSLAFDGAADLGESFFLDGNGSLASPSLRRVLEWSRTDIPPGAAIGSIALSGRITGDSQRLKIANAQIALDGNQGSGVLELMPMQPVPAVSGTLAFEKLDLASFLGAFDSGAARADAPGIIDTSFADQVSLDLRLSAANASAGPVALANVAATAQVKPDLVAFDISDATAFGGSLQFGVRIDRKSDLDQGEARLTATNVDGGALAAALGQTRFALRARGAVSASVRGPVKDWSTLLAKAEGTLTVKLGAGSIAGLDLGSFQQLWQGGEFFPIQDVKDGSLAIDSAELKTSIARGAARIEKAEAAIGDRRITLEGIAPLAGRSLALTGRIAPAKPAAGQPTPPMFFVGGSWAAPFVAPVVPPPAVQ